MGQIHDRHFPGENAAYRAARDELLTAEMALRQQIETVAALRRELPLGGQLSQDYAFDEGPAALSAGDEIAQTRLSELFAPGKDSLVLYSFMFAPGGTPCPACTSILDSFNGSAPHIGQRVNFAVVAKAPIGEVRAFARQRGWNNLRLLSSGGNGYNGDYHAEQLDGGQVPAINVFRRTPGGIFHFYNAELLYAPAGPTSHPRHADPLWPLWNLFDLTPEGRGSDWLPALSYD